MEYGHYAEQAAELASADLSSLEVFQELVVARGWRKRRTSSADLRAMRRFVPELHAVVDDSAAGNEAGVVRRLNRLLDQHPLRPRISGHDAQTWHLHVNDSGESVAEILIGEALYGMTLAVTELGADRFGWCAADSCGNAFFDATANHSKRFCSTRCATRTNVAAYRQRQSTAPRTAG